MNTKYVMPALLTTSLLFISLQASSHGYVDYPKARQQICKDDGGYWWPADGSGIPNAACRAAYQQSGGYMLTQHHEFSANVGDYRNMAAVQNIVSDGSLCAAGDSRKSGIDIPSTEWQRTTIDLATSSELTLRFRATTPHNPSFWQIYLSKPGYDAAAPLSWNQLELIYQQSDVPADAGYYTLQVPLPTARSGPAVLYTRWQRVDVVGEGFYNCSDIELVNGSGDTPPPLWFDKGAYVNLQTPAEVGGYAQLRLFDATGQELIDQSWQITANNIANALWATELAAQINTQYSNLLQIGLLNGDNVEFSSDIAANRAYVRDNSTFYNLDLRPAPDDGGDDGDNNPPGNCPGYDLTQINTYPNWPQLDWQGQPSHAASGDKLIYQTALYQANWWTQSIPGSDTSWTQLCSW